MDDIARRLLEGARTAQVVDLEGGSIPTSVLLEILTGATDERVHPRGVRVRNARVTGDFDWDWQTLVAPLELLDCAIEEVVRVDQAQVAGLSFRDCRLSGFSGENLVCSSHLRFIGCDVRGPVAVRGATIGGVLVATGATVRAGDDGIAFNATRIRTEAGIVLDQGFVAHGQVMLRAARIATTLYCRGGRFDGQGQEAISADTMEVGGNVFFTGGFETRGPLRMFNARIGGNLDFGGARLTNPGGQALSISGSTINGSVFFKGGFSSVGELRMNQVTIRGVLDGSDGRFAASGDFAIHGNNMQIDGDINFTGRPDESPGEVTGTFRLVGSHIQGSVMLDGVKVAAPGGVAIDAQDVHVGGNILMGKGFQADGEVHLAGVRLAGLLWCSGGTFRHPEGIALNLVNADVVDSVLLRPDCVFEGELSLHRARFGSIVDLEGARLENPRGVAVFAQSTRIGGDLNLQGATLTSSATAFVGQGLVVGGTLRWREMPALPAGRVDWRGASVGELDDDEKSWPAKGLARLSGFRYTRLSDRAPRDPKQRIAWIRRQPGYAAEPYQQLAEVYRANGQIREAVRVSMAQQDDLVRLGDLGRAARLWRRFLGLTIGHGYRPGRAAWMLLALYLITAGTVLVGARHDSFIQVGELAPVPGVTASRCSDAYPCFSVPAYALENITPFINLHQGENWHPKSSDPWETALRDWLYLCTVAGYAGTTLLAAGLSGLARTT